ncbi:MAG TPA: hypothetical protein P5052_01650 [Candidatus Paceibacterota bacterium]|nr:hypothetical protein [Candidatus Paceibacterota bacterium]
MHLKDFNNINNIKTIHDQHQQEMIRYYNDHPLEYDKDVEKLERAIIESKQHHKGKFKKGINPINGEES